MMRVTMPMPAHKVSHKVSTFFFQKNIIYYLSWTRRTFTSYMFTILPKQHNLNDFFCQQPIILSNKGSFAEGSEKNVSVAKKTNLATEWWFLHFQEHSSILMCLRIRTMFFVFQNSHFLCKIRFFCTNRATSEAGMSGFWRKISWKM